MANIHEVAKKQFNVRLEESLIKQLGKLAQADNRSTSNLVEKILTDHVKKSSKVKK